MEKKKKKPQRKSSVVIKDSIDRVQRALNSAQDMIEQKEDTPRSIEMDFVCSSLTILVSLHRLLEYYEGKEKEKAERDNTRWSDDDNAILRSIILPGYENRSSFSLRRENVERAASRLGRTYRAVRAQAIKILGIRIREKKTESQST